MTIAANGTPSASNPGTSATSITFSHTVTAGADQVLVVYAVAGTNVSAMTDMTATFNGVSMTKVALAHGGSTYASCCAFVLVAPDVTTADVVVTFVDSANARRQAWAGCYTGVDQTTPFAGAATYSATTAAPSFSVSAATDDLVVGGIGFQSNSGLTLTTDGSQTELLNSPETAAGEIGIGVCSEAGAASVALDWTLSGGRITRGVGFALKPASATPPDPFVTIRFLSAV